MRKGILSTLLLAGLVSLASAQQKTPTPAPAPSPAAPTAAPTKDIPLTPDEENKILKIQRQLQAYSISEEQRQKKSQDDELKTQQKIREDGQKLVDQLNTEVAAVRKAHSLPADTPFDQVKLAFQVPEKK